MNTEYILKIVLFTIAHSVNVIDMNNDLVQT